MDAHKAQYEVIIIGGGFAGASAALTLGRLKRSVLMLDSGSPCNRYSDAVHNLLLSEGVSPNDAKDGFKKSLSGYPTVTCREDAAASLERGDGIWTIATASGAAFTALRVLFCTGLADRLPPVPGMEACWGKTVLHCPYCHGYEMRGTVGIATSSVDESLALASVLHSLGLKMVLFTAPAPELTESQARLVNKLGVLLTEGTLAALHHDHGKLRAVLLADGRQAALDYLYIGSVAVQHSDLPVRAGCELTDRNLIRINDFHETSVPGIFAAGDCCSTIRYASAAMASGNIAASFIHQDLCRSFAT